MIKKIKTLISNIQKRYLYLMIFPMILMSNQVYANTIDKRIKQLGRDLSAFGNFFMIIIGVAGLVLLFLGIWDLKKNAEDSRSNSLAKAATMIVAGALMSGFVAFQAILSNSFVGKEPDRSLGRYNAGAL